MFWWEDNSGFPGVFQIVKTVQGKNLSPLSPTTLVLIQITEQSDQDNFAWIGAHTFVSHPSMLAFIGQNLQLDLLLTKWLLKKEYCLHFYIISLKQKVYVF